MTARYISCLVAHVAQRLVQLTAISGLSAKTYSWGGEGGRFLFAGGEACLGFPAAFLKKCSRLPGRMGALANSSSVDNGEDTSERPEEDIAGCGLVA